MDLGGMIPNPVVTSSSSSSSTAAATMLSFASAASTRDNEAVRVEDDDDDVATYHPTPGEEDNTEEEGEIYPTSQEGEGKFKRHCTVKQYSLHIASTNCIYPLTNSTQLNLL